jgi:hypothetical protein
MNVHAVFLHYLGDMISSFFVLIAGILLLVFSSDDVKWVEYIDPITRYNLVFNQNSLRFKQSYSNYNFILFFFFCEVC